MFTSTATMGLGLTGLASLAGSRDLLSGAEKGINQTVLANTDDQDCSVAMGVHTKDNLIAFAFIGDQDGLIRLRGGNPYALASIATLGDMVLGVGGTLTINGDLVDQWYPGDEIFITGCTTPANDGLYTIIDIVEAAGVSTLEVVQRLAVINVAVVEVFDTVEVGAGAANTVTKILPVSRKYYIDAGDDFTVAGPPGQIQIAEDLSFLREHDRILVQEATNAANNDIFTVTSATWAAPDTTIVVEEAVVVEAGNADCNLQLVRDEFIHRLEANVPTVWQNTNGILTPVLEDISVLEVSNFHPTADMTFDGLIISVPV